MMIEIEKETNRDTQYTDIALSSDLNGSFKNLFLYISEVMQEAAGN